MPVSLRRSFDLTETVGGLGINKVTLSGSVPGLRDNRGNRASNPGRVPAFSIAAVIVYDKDTKLTDECPYHKYES
jgi:hypothetical protein